MTCRTGDFARAVEHAKRRIAHYRKEAEAFPPALGMMRSEQIALEALLLVRLHQQEGVVLGRVDQLRAERPCGGAGVPGEHCARC